MPRAPGQIDEQKSEAIMAAAIDLFARKGGKASMAEIARIAGVSKQTLYNRYPSKAELARALLTQRSLSITSPLENTGSPQQALSGMAMALLTRVVQANSSEHLRALAFVSREDHELAAAVFDAGPARSLRRLSQWLKERNEQGQLAIQNPDQAAEMFVGMVLGHAHLRMVLGLEALDMDAVNHANETARRFVRAYAV
ncbi:TetR/AcrR family transcriptional regulator [Brevundimonas sp.]|uniref:TetR/AcrR family transcriptional regulator n=1 Tax=Brevundimonas sp. TaxID=1871086 RepID=UPI002FC687F9